MNSNPPSGLVRTDRRQRCSNKRLQLLSCCKAPVVASQLGFLCLISQWKRPRALEEAEQAKHEKSSHAGLRFIHPTKMRQFVNFVVVVALFVVDNAWSPVVPSILTLGELLKETIAVFVGKGHGC
jgi:hypothetical protein